MKLLNCMCGAKAFDRADFISCLDECCDICGPSNDPTGEKWNALMAPHQPKAEPAEGFVRVRIPLTACEDGDIYPSGFYRKSENKWYINKNQQAIAIVTADIPLPVTVEIKGTVE